MKPISLAFALVVAVPVAATAAPAAATHTIAASVQLRAADGKVIQALELATIEHECVSTRFRDTTRMFEVELCHRDDTADGKVIHVKWSLTEGKRTQEHEAWAVVASGGTLEVGAAKGKGDSLAVALK